MSQLLQRRTIKPRHLDQWRQTWPEEVTLRREHGFSPQRAFLETHAEPKLTWLFTHDDMADYTITPAKEIGIG